MCKLGRLSTASSHKTINLSPVSINATAGKVNPAVMLFLSTRSGRYVGLPVAKFCLVCIKSV
jgi:hypothetical protein